MAQDRFSRRLPPHGEINALSRRISALREASIEYLDLTESNPTRVGLPYPPSLLQLLADTRAMRYEPTPLGLWSAREAVANDCLRRGATVDPRHIVLSASSSESYSWLFKLLCDPGDIVLVPRPSYPLFDHLTRLEGVRALQYDLEYHGRWSIDFDRIATAPGETRAILLVSPNNPTGSYVSAAELERLVEICAERDWALVVDEVFADYVLDATAPVTDIATRARVLSFTLGGLSKTLGLPHLKLGWTIVGGPGQSRARALDALELIADTFLSVATPVQVALPTLFRDAAVVRTAIHARLRKNLNCARALASRHPACELLRAEGGWSAVFRIPATRTEDAFVLDLLDRERVLVHPGYFFDFPREAYIVVSLLAEEDVFADGCARALHRAAS